MTLLTKLRKHRAGNISIVFILVQLGCIIAYALFPQSFPYLSSNNIQVLLKSIPPLTILVMGVNILMIAGEFDLSVGSCFVMTSYILATSYNAGVPVVVSVLFALAVGAFIGWINGTIVVKTKIPSFIATLGAMMFWRGIVLLYSREQTAAFWPGGFFEDLFNSPVLGPIQTQFLWLLLISVGAYLLLERHKLGNHFYGVGGNRDAAIAVGVNADRVKVLAFVLVGMAAAFSGVVSTTRVHSVSPDQGKGLELQAIAACVIGGTNLMGGQGTVLGAFLGACLLFTIQNILLLVRAPGSYLDLFMGVLIVLAVIFNQMTRKD